MQQTRDKVEEINKRIEALLTRPTDDSIGITAKRRVVSALDTVKVSIVQVKPDDFPCSSHGENPFLFLAFALLVAFIYFSICLYMFLPPS